jgi:hypothetical protein
MAEQCDLPESFQSTRERVLKRHEEPINAAIIELSFRSQLPTIC